MKIKVSKNLYSLAKLFGLDTPLFVVGGYIRNSLLKLPCRDIDVCGCLKIKDVKKLLAGTEFEVNVKNSKLNTCEIICGKEKYEYATFRKEFYDGEGEHTPSSIDFNATIVEDVFRRDFTCNSLYYEIISGQIIDFFGGQKDIKDKVIKTVATPESVLCNDGVRVLRLIRFACELNFTIAQETFDMAEKYKGNLKSISKDRIRQEFVKILVASKTYKKIDIKSLFNRNRGYNGIKLIDKLNLWSCFGEDKRLEYLRGVGAYLKTYQKCTDDPVLSFGIDAYFYLKTTSVVLSPKDYLDMLYGTTGLNYSKKDKSKLLSILKPLDALDNYSKNFDCELSPKFLQEIKSKHLKKYTKAIGGKMYIKYKELMTNKGE